MHYMKEFREFKGKKNKKERFKGRPQLISSVQFSILVFLDFYEFLL